MSPEELIAIGVGAGLVVALVCLVIWGVLRGVQVQHKRDVAEMLAQHDAAEARRALLRAHRPGAR